MFLTLLIASFAMSFVVCAIVAKLFYGPMSRILRRLVEEDIFTAWSKYLVFAIFVVGISGGVRVWELERYINPVREGETLLILNGERWVLEIYRTLIGTLQATAWALLVFFMVALIAFVIVKGRELKRGTRPEATSLSTKVEEHRD
jgi:uncharacterized ion transporter superfamily protein YfcC